ncbi:MAG: hypothetical protein JXR94_02745 [Candidatus Hydrogenedentes bacterium]|nr:hypothetical protein [Candidatus Hydrogenedentota bacterium]
MNVVMGAVSGLDFLEIAPFLYSLQRSGFEGNLILYAQDESPDTVAQLRDHGVHIIEVDAPDALKTMRINCLRYFVYQQVLPTLSEDAEHVMLADIRDIVFQRDPFAFDIDGRLCCFLEDKSMTIGSSIVNAGWIAAGYGRDALAEMQRRPISCSGTTIGPLERIRDYVDTMVDGLREVSHRVPYITHVLGAIDQAVHNTLLFRDALGDVRLVPNENGPILTMNYVPEDGVRFNDEGWVVSGDGTVINVLHQYDRHPALMPRILERLGLTLEPPAGA